MKFKEVMAELPALTIEQRQLVMRRALELDHQPLSEDEQALARKRLAEYRQNPQSALSLQEMENRIRARPGA